MPASRTSRRTRAPVAATAVLASLGLLGVSWSGGSSGAWSRGAQVDSEASSVDATVTFASPGLRRAASVQQGRAGVAGRVARHAYQPILRRDPQVNANMQKWVGQQMRVMKRQVGARENDTPDAMLKKKAAYLAKLGLTDKAKELTEAKQKAAWHVKHMVAGDVFKGSFEHPDMMRGDKIDVTITVTSPTEGTWVSRNADFEGKVSIVQDFPIPFEEGEERDMAMAAYVFQKFNLGWRDFEQAVPAAEDMERISLKSMQMFFSQVAEVEGFPDEEDFRESSADPEKGMTKEEFLAYVKDDDPNYLVGAFPNVFTGRRVRLMDEDLALDGDFQPDANGVILGYASLNGRGGGSFTLELQQ